MKGICLAAVAVIFFGSPAIAGEAVALTCSGSEGTSTMVMGSDNMFHPVPGTRNFNFGLIVNPTDQTVLLNGKPMQVLNFGPDDVRFAARKPGLLSVVTDSAVYILSRSTGVIRVGGAVTGGSGSGICKVAAPALF